MPLIASRVPLKLGGLNTKTDERWVVPGDLVSARNVVYDAWPKLKKRNGYKLLAQAPAGALLQSYKSQLFLGTGAEAYGYAASGLVDKGPLEAVSVSARAVRRDAFAQSTADSAVHPMGITVYTWETTAGGAQYAVFDSATGQPIVSGASLGANAARPKPFALGQAVVVLFFDTATNRIRFIAVPVSTPQGPTAAADIAADASSAAVFDAAVVGGINGAIYVAYANSAGANKISLRYLTPQFVASSAAVPTTTEAFSGCCAVFGDAAANVWVAYYSGSALKAFAYDAALSVQRLGFTVLDASPGTVRNVVGIAAGGSVAVLYEVAAAATYNNMVKTASATLAGAVTGPATVARSVGLASKPFWYLGRLHVLAAYQSALQSTYFLLSGSTVVAKLAPSLGAGLTAKSVLPEVNAVAVGVFSTVYLQADQLSSVGGNVFTQAGVMAGTFDFTQPQTAIELSDDLHVAGGIVSMFDGAQVCEHGFHLYPENLAFTAGGTGSITGQYQACAVYEWMDAQGLVHQSAPSPVVTVNASGSAYFDYSVSSLRLTSKSTPISVVFYRTLANGTVFFRVSSIASPNLNSTSADTVSAPLHGDTAADTSLAGNAELYSNPENPLAEVPNIAAPAALHVWRYRNRVALIPAENAYQWAFSKAFVAGVPVEFNAQQLFQSVSQDGGPLTCGIEMDEKNVLFTATRIYYVVGDGPAPNGTSPDYGSSPQAIPSDVGCPNRKSLVLTPKGVMFQSAKGIYLLGRDLSVSYVGAAVEAFNGLTVTAAKLVPNSRRVIFFTDGGVALVWDYYAEKWATFTGHDAIDAAVLGGLLVYLRADGGVMQETPGSYTDNGAPVLIGLKTSSLSFAGLSGFQRVWRFSLRGDYRSPHSLVVGVAYDDDPAIAQQESVNAGALLGTGPVADTTTGGVDNPGDGAFPGYEFVVKCKQQKCSSLQITLQESQSTPYGEGFSLSGITFLVGGLKGLHPVAKARAI